MNEELKTHLTSRETWVRLLYILLFAVIYAVAEVVIAAVVVFQFFHVLATGRRNPRVLALGLALSTFVYQVLRFVTFNTDAAPWPFAEWPGGTGGDGDELRCAEERDSDGG